ncbi:hypothetical protein [Rhodococcoides fascians]|uniref:hypothetical protein n=2 Tax=Rhodococcoides fascians TaxID=1828 RepID=UPI00117AFF52|nr:hypothetical protein [Rhodococcus fascians]
MEVFNRTQGNGRGGKVSLDTLILRASVTRRTAKDAVRILQELGYIKVTKRGSAYSGKANTYALGSPMLGADKRPDIAWEEVEHGDSDVFPKLRFLDTVHKGSTLTASQFRVLVEILNSTTPSGGYAELGCKDLMALTEAARGTVEAAISELRRSQWIEVQSDDRKGLKNIYAIARPDALNWVYDQIMVPNALANA